MAKLTITRGDSERLKAVITPYTAAVGLKFMAKKKLKDLDAAAIISKTLASGIAVTVVGNSTTPAEAMITINPAETQALPNKTQTLFYDLVDGANHTLDTGELIIKPEVLIGA